MLIDLKDLQSGLVDLTTLVGERVELQQDGKTVAVLVTPDDAAWLDEIEDRYFGELLAEWLAEFEKDPTTYSHEEAFGSGR